MFFHPHRHQLDFAGRQTELHHRLDRLAPCLQLDGVIVKTDNSLDGPCKKHVLRVYARGVGKQFDIESLLPKITKAVCQLGGE